MSDEDVSPAETPAEPPEAAVEVAAEEPWPPRIPASAGALIRDERGRLLILEPTYKARWTIPGGVMEADGETPWEACRREVLEETGLDVTRGDLVAVDFLRPRATTGKPGGMRFLFDCGTFADDVLAGVVVQEEEIKQHRLAPVEEALSLLSGPVRRRVAAALDVLGQPGRVCYLEEGLPRAE